LIYKAFINLGLFSKKIKGDVINSAMRERVAAQKAP
jgi:hypothetical protein